MLYMNKKESDAKTVEEKSNDINYKVIALIGALSIGIFFYTQYLQNTEIFDPIDGAFLTGVLACGTASILVAKKYLGSAMFTKAYLLLGLGFYA